MDTVFASDHENPHLSKSFWLWASDRIFGHFRGFGPCSTLGVFDDKAMIAVVVYHNYHGEAGVVEMSAAAESRQWLKRRVLFEMFSIPFDEWGCQAVSLRTSPDQRHIRRMLKAYGCTEHLLPRLRGRDEDECVFILTDDAWRANGFHRSTDISQGVRENELLCA